MNYTPEVWANLSFEEQFPIVKASEFSMESSFMRFRPRGEAQILLWESLEKQIHKGIEDFRRPAIDPSLDESGNLIYCPEREVAVEIKSELWNQMAENFMSSKHSRVGTTAQYDAWLGTILNYWVEERNLPVEMAWNEVCFNCELMANVFNALLPMSEGKEKTGSRKVDCWADLGNVQKIVRKSEKPEDGFLYRGCTYLTRSPIYNLTTTCKEFPELGFDKEKIAKTSTLWVVMDV